MKTSPVLIFQTNSKILQGNTISVPKRIIFEEKLFIAVSLANLLFQYCAKLGGGVALGVECKVIGTCYFWKNLWP